MSTRDHQSQVNDLGADEARRTLVAVIKAAFPHERIPDGPYERQADNVLAAAAGMPWMQIKLLQGLDSLQGLADGDFAALDPDAAFRLLQRVEDTDFFRFVRSTVVVGLYEDEEVWSVIGYEGPSFDKGGYIDRGFDDLDWLPDPRIEEYDGPEEWRDVVSGGATYGSAASTVSPAAPAGQTKAQAMRVETGRI